MSEEKRTKEPLRVLHVFGGLNMGGAESRTVELYRAIDRSRVQFDFLVHTDAQGQDTSSAALMARRAPEHFDGTVKELGARIFAVPRFRGSNYFAYKKAIRTFFDTHRGAWAAVHGHMTSTASMYLPLAGEHGAVPLLIAHARSAGVDPGLKGIVTNLLRRPLRKADCPYVRLAVSKTAGAAVFGETAVRRGDVHVIPNAITPDDFAYDTAARTRIRAKHGMDENAFVIGHVGSFRFAKNHAFLLKVFAAWKKLVPHSRLLLVGDGERMREIRETAAAEGMAEDVIFAGKQSGIAAYYSAMDALVFPSRYEGMPGTVIEAQAAGLPCLVSEAVTEEVAQTAFVRRLPLTDAPERWAEALKALCVQTAGGTDTKTATPAGENRDREETSAAARRKLAAAGFDISIQAERMTAFYLSGALS